MARLLILALAVATGGCLKSLPFECSTDPDCGSGGLCESNRFCSFADSSCASGRRFGELSGPVANTCVGDSSIDAGIDVPMNCPNDLDCDQFVDTNDNCPSLYNPSQDNEDGDMRGDACDICPAFSDTGADTDMDGVGNLCDPNPSMMGDSIVEFLTFRSMPAGWTAEGFSTSNGDAVANASAGEIVTFLRPAPAGTRYSLYAEATLASIAGASLGAIGLTLVHEQGTDAQLLCQGVGMSNGTQHELRLFDTGTGFTQLDSNLRAFDVDERFAIQFHRNGNNYSCNATNPAASVAGSSVFAPTNPEVGIRSRSVGVRYHWVLVVRTQ